MRTKMRYMAGSFVFMASVAFAGGSQGGGTPPAREQLAQMLMSETSTIDGGLFDNGLGDPSILTRSRLQPQMTVTRAEVLPSDFEMPLLQARPRLTFSQGDFTALRDRKTPIDAMGAEGQNLSFKIEAGETLDSLTLRDRRELMRAAIK